MSLSSKSSDGEEIKRRIRRLALMAIDDESESSDNNRLEESSQDESSSRNNEITSLSKCHLIIISLNKSLEKI